MSYEDELAGLRLRLTTDPTRADTVQRRIAEVEALIPPAIPETAKADMSEVQAAVMPGPRRGRPPKSESR